MNAKGILLPILLLLGSACWLLWQDTDEVAPPGNATEHTERSAKDAALVRSAADTSPHEVEASNTTGTASAVRDAVLTRTPVVPIPDDATWVEVRVVDKATQAPVPDATVCWHDETANKILREDKTISLEDRFTLWRDPEELAMRYGWTTTSNAQGIARVHLSVSTQVLARHEHQFGRLEIGKKMLAPRDGYRVEIEPDLAVQVQVLDQAGRPAPGVPIGVAVHDKEGKFQYMWNWGPSAMTRGPDAIASITHVQDWQREERKNVAQWRVRTMVPGWVDEGVQIDLDKPPAETIILRLPACGKVRARVEILGKPFVPPPPMTLHDAGAQRSWNGDRSSLEGRPDADGWTRFQYVPLGVHCSVYADVLGGSLRQTFAGPVAADAEISVVLSPTDEHILLTGRLLSEQRIPLAEQKFQFKLAGPQLGAQMELETDNEGGFMALIGRSRKDNRADSISAEVRREGERPLSARLAGRELRPGTEQLGDLVLQLDALLVSGTYRLDGKPCKLHPSVRLEKLTDNAEGGNHKWRRQSELLYYQDDEGHFESRGTFTPGRYRLLFTSWNHLPHDPVEFDAGAKDLVIELEEGSPLAATMLLPKGARDEPQARLIPEGPAPDWAKEELAQPNRGGRLRANTNNREEGRIDLQWRTLPAGSYRLEIHLGPVAGPLLQIEGVQIPAPKGGDPRLVDIDLRTLLGVQLIHLFDTLGKPVQETDGAFFPLGQDMTKQVQGFQCQGAESKVLMPVGVMDLMVAVSGYRPTTIRCTGEPLDVRIDPWPTIKLQVPGADKLPAGLGMQIGLRSQNQSTTRYRSSWNSGELRDLTEPSREQPMVHNNATELPIGDGPYEVVAFLFNKNNTFKVEMPTMQVLSTTLNATVQIPPDALAAAIAKAMPAPK
jgi:hypothetical protein